MKLTQNSGRVFGLLFLLTSIAGGVGTAFRGLSSGAPSTTTTFLKEVFENTSQMKQAIGLDMLSTVLALCMVIFLYPYVKKHNQRVASGYLAIGIINSGVITISNIFHFALLAISANYMDTTPVDASYYTVVSHMLYESYYSAHFITLILFSIGNFILMYYFFKTHIIPKVLVIWGFLANFLVFLGGLFQLADISVSGYLFVQNGIYILIFIIWLLIKGFSVKNSFYEEAV